MTQEKTSETAPTAPKNPQKRGLGRGLSALIPQAAAAAGGVHQTHPQPIRAGNEETESAGERALALIPLRSISLNPLQPRKTFGKEELEELASSIREHGVLQPIVVRPKPGARAGSGAYELVAGERRFRAASSAGLTEIPAVVREMDDQTSLAVALIENIQREDLNVIEAAQAYEQLLHEFHMTQAELAQELGKSQPQIANAIRILGLPSQVQDSVRDGRISEGHAKVILSVSDASDRLTLWSAILESQLTVRAAEREAAKFAPGARRSAPTAKTPPPNEHLEEISRKMSLTLGTKVRLTPGKGQKGVIEIAYYDHDQLEGLLDRLNGKTR